jgi:AcrR family transcriptional regulator
VASTSAPRPARKRRGTYHHGDLRNALIREAARTIQDQGVAGLTLRAVGLRLGVSRTALYRHFSDKSALLTAVARVGFRTFRQELVDAGLSGGGGREGFEAMGRAYVRFAVNNPAHYRVMFGGFLEGCQRDPELAQEAAGSFQVLVDALVKQQQAGRVRQDDPTQLAGFVWAIVHGIAMLAIDGQLRGRDPDAEVRFAIQRLATGIGRPESPTPAAAKVRARTRQVVK